MKALAWMLAGMNILLSLFIGIAMIDAVWSTYGGWATLGLLLVIPAVQVANVFACAKLEQMDAANHRSDDSFFDRLKETLR